MTKAPVARTRSQVGATTAEYAVTTAAACGFGGVLISLLTSDFGKTLLKALFHMILSLLGISL